MASVVFLFFKQKTAYEMRISEWSSDVCASDLIVVSGGLGVGSRENWRIVEDAAAALGAADGATRAVVELGWVPASQQVGFSGQKDRKSAVWGKSFSGHIDLGGRRIIINKNLTT